MPETLIREMLGRLEERVERLLDMQEALLIKLDKTVEAQVNLLERVTILEQVQEVLLTKIDKTFDTQVNLLERVTVLEQLQDKTGGTVQMLLDNAWKLAVAVLSGWLIYKLK